MVIAFGFGFGVTIGGAQVLLAWLSIWDHSSWCLGDHVVLKSKPGSPTCKACAVDC